jgi:uncharacterized MAPEG superfamily protein
MANQNPAFVAYTVSASVLVLNQIVLWMLSGSTRIKAKVAFNPEDTTTVSKGAAVVTEAPEEVARILRVHNNGQANILQFLILGALFVQAGGSGLEAQILFGAFTAFRLLYTVVYLAGKQPWRSLTFFLGLITTLALIVEVLRHVFM